MSDPKDLALEALRRFDIYEAKPADRGGAAGPKGRAWAAFQDAKGKAFAAAAGTPIEETVSDEQFRDIGFTGMARQFPRDEMAIAMFTAFVSANGDPLPSKAWHYFPNKWTMEAWGRVAAAAYAFMMKPTAEPEKAAGVDAVAEARRETRLLAEAIASAAIKAGIYNGEAPLTGPHLLMLCDDMADNIKHAESVVEEKRLRFEGDLDRWMKALGAGITGYQPEAYALMDAAVSELVSARTEIAKLKALLEQADKVIAPFADEARTWQRGIPDNVTAGDYDCITVGDLRRAAQFQEARNHG